MPDRTIVREIFRKNIEFGNIAHDFIWTCEEYLNFIRPLFYFNVNKVLESIKRSLLKRSVFSPRKNFTKSFRNLIPNLSHHAYYFTKHQNGIIQDYQTLLEKYVYTLQTYIDYFRNLTRRYKSIIKDIFAVREDRQQYLYILDLTKKIGDLELLFDVDHFLRNPFEYTSIYNDNVAKGLINSFSEEIEKIITLSDAQVDYRIKKRRPYEKLPSSYFYNEYDFIMQKKYEDDPSYREKIRTFEKRVLLQYATAIPEDSIFIRELELNLDLKDIGFNENYDLNKDYIEEYQKDVKDKYYEYPPIIDNYSNIIRNEEEWNEFAENGDDDG